MKILLIAVAIVLAFFFSKIPVSIENDAKGFDGDISKSGFIEAFLSDNEQSPLLFSQEEASAIDRAVKEAAKKLQMNIFVYASRSQISDADTEMVSDESYDELFGPDTDGVFYYMDLSGKTPAYDYISTSGKAILAYQNNIDSIFYELDNYLPSSKEVQENGLEPYKDGIMDAIGAFLSEIESYSHEASPSNEAKVFHSSRTGKYVYYRDGTLFVTTKRPPMHRAVFFFICEILGLIAAWIFTSSVRRKYFFVSKPNSRTYMKDNETRFYDQKDTFIREHTSRTSVSSSSGGGGHRSGGGGTHGGGGHHR